MLSDDFLYKAQTKQICHITAGKVNYHMTQISTNNKYLKLGISSKFDQLQNISLTQARCQHNLSSKILPMSSPAPNTFCDFSLATKLQRPLFQLSHWSPEHIAHYNFPLLIIIPGIHSLACPHNDKITHYNDKSLLDFVEILFLNTLLHYIYFSQYFNVHILCILYKNFINLEIIYVNH